jgi:Mn2+/Fe2+ NRAMP family transporter
METLNQVLSAQISPLFGILLTLTGMFFYYVSEMMGGKSIEKFSDLQIKVWWQHHQIKFTMICMVVSILFYLSWKYSQLTAQHCFELGIMGNLFLDKFLTRMKIGDSSGNS